MQQKCERLAVNHKPGPPYLASADDVRLGRQQVYDFPFALVSPLRTEHHRRFVARVAARSLLPGRRGLVCVLVVFRRPAQRHVGGGSGLSVSGGLNRLQPWHGHICNIVSCDVRAGRARAKCVAALRGKLSPRLLEPPQRNRHLRCLAARMFEIIPVKTFTVCEQDNRDKQLNVKFTLLKYI